MALSGHARVPWDGRMRNLFRKEPRYIPVPGLARTAPGAGADRTADGLWVRCENERCRELLYIREFENNLKSRYGYLFEKVPTSMQTITVP